MRLIDADALRDALGITGTVYSCKGCKYHNKYGCGYGTDDTPPFEYVCEMIDNAPSAQPEGIKYVELSEEDYEKMAEQLRKIPIVLTPSEPEIIRCKDCKNFGGGTYCYERDGMWDENDFCSYAERRGEEDEDE